MTDAAAQVAAAAQPTSAQVAAALAQAGATPIGIGTVVNNNNPLATNIT